MFFYPYLFFQNMPLKEGRLVFANVKIFLRLNRIAEGKSLFPENRAIP